MRWTKDIYTSIEKYYQKLHVFLYVLLKYCIMIFIIAGPKYFLFQFKEFALVLRCTWRVIIVIRSYTVTS